MRNRLSDLLCKRAADDPKTIVLCGDHGYALFDPLRKEYPNQFLNCGVSEQAMIGYAAGLARMGYHPIVYGLASFVPMRCLEQIKIDLCLPKLKVTIIGDGAGVVYSQLGASHQCGEDIAVLRPLPNMHIYSPCDKYELDACWNQAWAYSGPSYIRIGKADRPVVGSGSPFFPRNNNSIALVATGAMVSPALGIAEKYGLSLISVPCLKPFHFEYPEFKTLVVIEEHSQYGGLYSAVCEETAKWSTGRPRVISCSLKDEFIPRIGSYQYALSQHQLSDNDLDNFIRGMVYA